jgi:hypothetical protein
MYARAGPSAADLFASIDPMLPSGAPPTPGPAVNITGVAFHYVSEAPCDFSPPFVPPAAVAVGAGRGPPEGLGSGPCELPMMQWPVRCTLEELAAVTLRNQRGLG